MDIFWFCRIWFLKKAISPIAKLKKLKVSWLLDDYPMIVSLNTSLYLHDSYLPHNSPTTVWKLDDWWLIQIKVEIAVNDRPWLDRHKTWAYEADFIFRQQNILLSKRLVMMKLGLNQTGHMSFLTGQDRTLKFAGHVLPDRTESRLIFLDNFPTNYRLLLLIR